MFRARTIYPRRGWLEVIWSADQRPSPVASLALAVAGEIPGCRVLGDGPKQHSLEVPYTAWMLPQVHDALEALEQPLPPAALDPVQAFRGVPVLRQPYQHQIDGFEFLLAHRGVLLADEMGLGKTTTAAIAAGAVCATMHKSGIIVGPRVTRSVWFNELKALGLVDIDDDFCALESTNTAHSSFRRGAHWYFCHFEILKTWWSKIYAERPAVLIVDEAHYVRNGRAQRSRATELAAAGTATRFLLTGSPLDSRPSELWFPLSLACGRNTWGAPNAFRKRYCGAVENGFGLQDAEPTHVDELKQRLSVAYLRRTVAEVGSDMPDFQRQSQLCDIGDGFRADHDSALDGADLKTLVHALSTGMISQVLPLITKLRMLTSLAKVSATIEEVHSALEQGESVVVFAWTREIVEKLHATVGKVSKLRIDGSLPPAARDAHVQYFQERDIPTVLFATYGSLREAVTLHKARLVILHDLELTISAMLQAEKRVHRLGQRRACISKWMLANHTVDTLIAPILQRKIELLKSFDIEPEGEVDLSVFAPTENDFQAQVARSIAVWEAS